MVEQFVNEFISKIDQIIEDEEKIQEIQLNLFLMFENYEINKKVKDLVPYKRELPECYKVFMVTKKIEGLSKNTLEIYKLYIEDFLRQVNKDVKDITSNDIRLYLYYTQQNRGISNRSLDQRRSTLSSFFGWLVSEGYITNNPILVIKPIKYTREERKPLTDMEMEQVRNSCNSIRERALIEFMYSTGCRVSELTNLNLSDINFDTREVVLFGKGSKYRTSFLTAKSIYLLKEYLEQRKSQEGEQALFIAEKKPYQRLTKAGIEKIIREIGLRADIPRLHPHLLRHTMATDCLQKGMEVTQVQKILGHSNVETTMIYAKADEEDIKKLHQKYL